MFFEEEWDMTKSLVEIQQGALKDANIAIQEQKEEILCVWKVIYFIEKTVVEEGILALEEKVETIEQMKISHYELLYAVIQLLADGTEPNLIFEVITNDYYTRERDEGMDFILFLIILCVKNILQFFRFGCPDPKTLSEVFEHDMMYIPSQFCDEFHEVLRDYL